MKQLKNKDIFLRGKAHIKFLSNINDKDSKSLGFKKFDLVKLYDISIEQIEEISPFEYTSSKYTLRAPNFSEICHIFWNDRIYALELSDIKLVEEPTILHEQENDDQLMGEFKLVRVYFKIPRKSNLTKAIKTGKQITQNGVVFEEYYSIDGKIELLPIKALRGKPTGRVQQKVNKYRVERFNANGSTYWDNWTEEHNFKFPSTIKPGPTGLTRKFKGRFQRQVLTDEKTFVWANSSPTQKIDVFATIVVVFLMSILLCFAFYLSRQADGYVMYYIVLPITFSLVIIVPLINYFLKSVQRVKKIFVQLNWIFITLLFTGLFLYGFSKIMASTVSSNCQYKSYDEIPAKKQKNYSIDQKQDAIHLKYTWNDSLSYPNRTFTVKFHINKDSLCACNEVENDMTTEIKSRYINLIVRANKNLNEQRSKIITVIHEKLNSNDILSYLNAIVSFSQSRKRSDDNYAIKKDLISPAYFLLGIDDKDKISFKADCDGRTLATFFLLFNPYDNIDVAIFNYEDKKRNKRHSMLGIHYPNDLILPSESKYKIENGKKYYLWELTAKYPIGRVHKNYSNLDMWGLTLSESDIK